MVPNCAHPGERIRDYVNAQRIHKANLAARLGLSRVSLNLLMNSNLRVSPKIAAGLEKELGFRAESLLEEQAEYDLAKAQAALEEYRDQGQAAQSKQMSFAMTG